MANPRALWVLNRAPQAGGAAMDALDAALTAAAFEVPVSVLLLDDGVWQLCPPDRAPGRNPARLLPGLELYDIATPPWVETESLLERGLSVDDLIMPVERIERRQLAELWRQFDWVIQL